MSYVEVVIKIPKKLYNFAKGGLHNFDAYDMYDVSRCIANGISLPKGHGRLVDGDALLAILEKDISKHTKYMEYLESVGDMKGCFNVSRVQTGMVSCMRVLNNANTIIKADGGDTE